MPMPFRDKTGQSFGFWTVLGFSGRDNQNATVWLCKCVCGTERNVVVGSLMKGRSKSCGCQQYIVTSEKNTKHGMAGTPTYKSWHAMLQRCEGKGDHKSYLKRNITVCEEWFDFNVFLADMGIRPKNKTLDRIDNTKGYSKDNCRWATNYQQMNNRTNTVYVTVDQETMAISDACRKYKIGISCARHRLNRGMSHEETFKTPTRSRDAL
jgi:hypothetical protein